MSSEQQTTALAFTQTVVVKSGTPKGIHVTGRVWQEDNGDIRFEPAQGFVGTSSFTNYTPGKQTYAL